MNIDIGTGVRHREIKSNKILCPIIRPFRVRATAFRRCSGARRQRESVPLFCRWSRQNAVSFCGEVIFARVRNVAKRMGARTFARRKISLVDDPKEVAREFRGRGRRTVDDCERGIRAEYVRKTEKARLEHRHRDRFARQRCASKLCKFSNKVAVFVPGRAGPFVSVLA